MHWKMERQTIMKKKVEISKMTVAPSIDCHTMLARGTHVRTALQQIQSLRLIGKQPWSEHSQSHRRMQQDVRSPLLDLLFIWLLRKPARPLQELLLLIKSACIQRMSSKFFARSVKASYSSSTAYQQRLTREVPMESPSLFPSSHNQYCSPRNIALYKMASQARPHGFVVNYKLGKLS